MSIYARKNEYPLGYYIYCYIRNDGISYYIGKGQKKRAKVVCHLFPEVKENTIRVGR